MSNRGYDPDDYEPPAESVDANGLTLTEKEDLRDFAKRLNKIFVYKIANGEQIIDASRTKKAREDYIKLKGLKVTYKDPKKIKPKDPKEVKVEYYAKDFEIAADDHGIPVFKLKQL